MRIVPKKSPKWHEGRKWIARWLVRLAYKIQPQSEDVMAFHIQQMTDMLITGRCVTRINPFAMEKEYVEPTIQ